MALKKVPRVLKNSFPPKRSKIDIGALDKRLTSSYAKANQGKAAPASHRRVRRKGGQVA